MGNRIDRGEIQAKVSALITLQVAGLSYQGKGIFLSNTTPNLNDSILVFFFGNPTTIEIKDSSTGTVVSTIDPSTITNPYSLTLSDTTFESGKRYEFIAKYSDNSTKKAQLQIA